MTRVSEALAHRLRRLASALGDRADMADTLLLETLNQWEHRTPTPMQAATGYLQLRHERDAQRGYPRNAPIRPAGTAHPDIVRAFDTLPILDREVLTLIVIERFSYDEVAHILGISLEETLERLTRARERFARAIDDEPPVQLRIIK